MEDISLDLTQQLIEELNISPKEMSKIEERISELEDESNYTILDLVYYGEPKAQPRARSNSVTGFFYDPGKSLKQWMIEQVLNLLPKNFKPISTSISLKAKFFRTIPKSASRTDKVLMEMGYLRPTVKPDIDNYDKLLLDALKNVLYTDDSLIVDSDTGKYYSTKPRVEIIIKFKNP